MRKIEFREVPDVDALIAESDPVSTIVVGKAAAPRRALGTLLFAGSADIQSIFYAPYESADIKVGALTNVSVGSSSIVRSASEVLLFGAPLQPGYVPNYIELGRLPAASEDLSAKVAVPIDKLCALVTHFNVATYGHWLLECLPKLLLLKHVAARLPGFSILLPKSAPGFIKSWISLILPAVEVVSFDDKVEFAQCRKLLIPGLCLSNSYVFHPILNSWIDSLVNDAATAVPPVRVRRLYVTRQRPSGFRIMENQSAIEDIAYSRGFALVSPETLPIAQQIVLFAGAELIASEFGSSLHNTLFAPSHSTTLALNYINACQTRVAQLRGHDIGYILPPGGPLTYDHDLRTTRRGYHIEPHVFAARLDETLINAETTSAKRAARPAASSVEHHI